MPLIDGEPLLSRSTTIAIDLDDTDSSPPTPLPWTPHKTVRARKRVLGDDDDDDAHEALFKAADPEVIEIVDTDNTETEDVVQADDDAANPADPILGWGDDDYDVDFDDCCASRMESTVELPISTLISPRSSAVNYEPSLPITTESQACDDLVALAQAKAGVLQCVPDYVYIELDDFEIYNSSSWATDRLRSLHILGGLANDLMFFDGVLSVGDTRFYVERVPFKYAPVDKYGPGFDTVRGHISIRSLLNSRRDVYYRLGRPSPAYGRFYYPYLWVADLGKHFIDYADKITDKPGGDVRISHFRASFGRWLDKRHARSAAVKAWKHKFRPDASSSDIIDFRPAVIANKDYLRKEAYDVLGAEVASSLSFFREVKCDYYPTHTATVPAKHPPNKPLPTVVTPYIYYTFRDLVIQKYMTSTSGKYTPKTVGNESLLPQGQNPFVTGEPIKGESLADRIKRIQPGDIISTTPDDKGSGSKWAMDFDGDGDDDMAQQTGKRWYALVHRVNEPQPRPDGQFDRDAQRSFDIAWLYAPQHTPCRQSTYPWKNELFLSDHCTCDEDDDACIEEDEVSNVHSVEWFGGPDTAAEFFIRQTFMHGERSWIQLRLGHIFCQTSADEAFRVGWFQSRWTNTSSPIGQFVKEDEYAVGDTVLAVVSKRDTRSEPYIIEGKKDGTLQLRVLLRRHELDASDAPPNELVYTDETIDLGRHSDGKLRKSARIIGRCIVRVFEKHETIPTPYCRNGAGNVFYITHRLAFEDTSPGTDAFTPLCVPMGDEPVTFRQGFDPATPIPRLRALELFCGCGNLGRGIEDAGATETRCANDIWPVAMHTFMANVASEAVEPFIGSADTLLGYAIRGVRTVKAPAGTTAAVKTTNIPRPGEIDFISGGSPCQGFSKLTPDRTTPQQFKNRSMVASFASFVDLYRPKFGILENVAAMAESKKASGKEKEEDIFGQLICALLGMGYQLRIMLGNAWFYGTPQKRQRVFIIFAAPGQQLPQVPLPSHGPSTQVMGGENTGGVYKAIGDTQSGNWITTVLAPPATAFPFVSSGEATADLADIDDGVVDICVRHPDHRTIGVSDDMRCKLAQIPTQPYGLGLAEVRHTRGFRAMRHLFSKGQTDKAVTNAYKRHNPTRMFRTVRTACVVADARGAGDLHWRDKRPMSIMEMRRAQGVPDDDLLLFERKTDQWKMVGNAVARQIALALGLSLREAYLGGLAEVTEAVEVVEATEATEAKDVNDADAANQVNPRSRLPPKTNRIFQTSPYASKTMVVRDKRERSASTESELDSRKRQKSGATVVSLADCESD